MSIIHDLRRRLNVLVIISKGGERFEDMLKRRILFDVLEIKKRRADVRTMVQKDESKVKRNQIRVECGFSLALFFVISVNFGTRLGIKMCNMKRIT